MGVVWTLDVNDIDVFPLNQFSPVRFDRCVTPLVGECLHTLEIASADSLKDRNVRHVEEATHLQKCVGMRAAHEAVSDETDVEIAFCHFSLLRIRNQKLSIGQIFWGSTLKTNLTNVQFINFQFPSDKTACPPCA